MHCWYAFRGLQGACQRVSFPEGGERSRNIAVRGSYAAVSDVEFWRSTDRQYQNEPPEVSQRGVHMAVPGVII